MTSTVKRLEKELRDLTKTTHRDIPENVSVGPHNSNLFEWDATIIGAVDTPYEGGIFNLKIYIPKEYPYVPPKVQYATKIFHPNIHENGDICLDILKSHWSPAYNLTQVMLSIVSLMSDPNPDDPLNTDAANLYKMDIRKYNEMVRMYVEEYARGE